MLGLLAFQMLPQLFSKGGTANMQVHGCIGAVTFGYIWIYESSNLRSDDEDTCTTGAEDR